MQAAQQYKIRGFERLSKDGNDYTTDFYAIKQYLAKGAPIIIGNMVGGSFMQDMMGKKYGIPRKMITRWKDLADIVCIIGYDDRLEGGAFQIMNSWVPLGAKTE